MQHSFKGFLIVALALSISHPLIAMLRTAACVAPVCRVTCPRVQGGAFPCVRSLSSGSVRSVHSTKLPNVVGAFVGGMYAGIVMGGFSGKSTINHKEQNSLELSWFVSDESKRARLKNMTA